MAFAGSRGAPSKRPGAKRHGNGRGNSKGNVNRPFKGSKGPNVLNNTKGGKNLDNAKRGKAMDDIVKGKDAKVAPIKDTPVVANRFKAWMDRFKVKTGGKVAEHMYDNFRKNVAVVMEANKLAAKANRPMAKLSAFGPNAGFSLEEFGRSRLGLVDTTPAKKRFFSEESNDVNGDAQKRSLAEVENKKRQPKKARTPAAAPAGPAKGSVDWRSVMTKPVNQRNCGSCWAFSTLATIEAAIAIKTRKSAVKLSEQHLVDCARAAPNNACKGGAYLTAMQWIVRNGGVASDSSYPYKARLGQCRPPAQMSARIVKPVAVGKSESAMMAHVSRFGPISVSVDAFTRTWQFYNKGIITATDCGTKVNHGVNIVGYTTISNVPVWIIRNSWGTKWGMDGYAYLERNTNACGVTKAPVGVQV